MAFGLEIRNASGALTLSSDSRLVRYIGSVSFSSIPARGYLDVAYPGVAADGSWLGYCSVADVSVEFLSGVIRINNVNVLLVATGVAHIGKQ